MILMRGFDAHILRHKCFFQLLSNSICAASISRIRLIFRTRFFLVSLTNKVPGAREEISFAFISFRARWILRITAFLRLMNTITFPSAASAAMPRVLQLLRRRFS